MKYGWLPDLPDHRDFKYAISVPVELPQSVDLRPKCSPVENQQSIGSCTSNALVGNLEYLEMTNNPTSLVDLSRLFVYFNERAIEGTVEFDSGAMLRDGIKTLASDGVCSETLWPYDPNIFMTKPTDQCYQEAQSRKISAYFRLNSLNDMLKCLADGYPFVFGFSVYDYFESTEMAHTGILRMPTPDEGMLGGHAICAVGYDQSTKMLLIRNSWGNSWGIGGYFWMPFEYVDENRDLSDDFWTIRK
jgi:C1A family cysteine protease